MIPAHTGTTQVVQAHYDILTGGPAAYDPARPRTILAQTSTSPKPASHIAFVTDIRCTYRP